MNIRLITCNQAVIIVYFQKKNQFMGYFLESKFVINLDYSSDVNYYYYYYCYLPLIIS